MIHLRTHNRLKPVNEKKKAMQVVTQLLLIIYDLCFEQKNAWHGQSDSCLLT